MTPNTESYKVYTDADFPGNWDASIAEFEPATARSLSGSVIMYAGCPNSWASRLQTKIAMSSTESEYIALSQSLREFIPVMRLVNELNEAGFHIPGEIPHIPCRAFEDYSGAL
jgi:hypothetical protein